MAKKSIRFSLFFIFSLLFLQTTSGQQTASFAAWASASIKVPLASGFSLSAEEEIRTGSGSYISDAYFTNVQLAWEVRKHIEVAGGYRWTRNYEKEGFYSNSHRWMADVEYSFRLRRYELAYRQRVEYQIKGYGDLDAVYPAGEWRTRGTAEAEYYLTQRVRPYLSADLRYVIHDPYNPEIQQFDRLRFTGGFNYHLNQQHRLSIDGRIQRYFTGQPESEFILRISYRYELLR